MILWVTWFNAVMELRASCAREATFFWMVICLMGLSIRSDFAGVTSFVRALGLKGCYYDRILDCLQGSGIDLKALTDLWVRLVFKLFTQPLRVNGRLVALADGFKAAKEGRKMPGVKSLHQDSQNNSKSEYIMGHSCQAVSLVVAAGESFFAVPLVSRIHEGVVTSNRDQKTLLDKLILLVRSLKIPEPFYLVADAYYATAKVIKGLLADKQHLISRVKSNAVAYEAVKPSKKPKKGRPKLYGKKIKLNAHFKKLHRFISIDSPVYGETNVKILYSTQTLIWRSAGLLVKFIWVIHPIRGKIILITTDLNLDPIDAIRLYGIRFKIELSFKNAVHVLGTYSYHFWMKSMTRIKQKSGDQYLHHKPREYRERVAKKMEAYHRHIQLGLIAQGLLQYLAATMPEQVWLKFGSWIRTIRKGRPPSEQTVSMALRSCLPEFLADSNCPANFKKFLFDKIDFGRAEGIRLAA